MFKSIQGKMMLVFFLIGIILIGGIGMYYIHALDNLVAITN